MTIREFLDKYNLHDSYFEKVTYNEGLKTLILIINFAFWMQEDYVDGNPENGKLQVVFKNVNFYSCNGGDPCGEFVGIIGANLDEKGDCVIALADDIDLYFEMVIYAESVSVVGLLG